MLLLAWTVDVSCILYVCVLLVGLSVFFGGCAPHNFKENLSYYMYVSMYMSCCCFTCNFVKCVCSRKANFYVIIDNTDDVFCIL